MVTPTPDDWRAEVADGQTLMGYQEWLTHKYGFEGRDFDHHAGEKADGLPVGTKVRLPVFALDVVPRTFIRDDDGWRCLETDTYLHYDIEDFDFDVVELGETYCDTLGHDWRHNPVEHVTICTKCWSIS